MKKNILNIEEELDDEGQLVKRFVNGVECLDGKFPKSIRIEEFDEVVTRKTITATLANKLFGYTVGSKGTN